MADNGKISDSKTKDSELLGTSSGQLIFISHDMRDAELAEAFSKLLSSVSAGVLKSFRSSDRKGSQGIEYGVEWYPELMSKLDVASDVVCLLTQRSLDRPWILYEAGVAKGKLNTPVYGIALGIPLSRANNGPFAQFQNCDDNQESLTKLVMQLVKRIPGSEPDHDAIEMQVKSFKEKVTNALEKLSDSKAIKEKAPVAEASVSKLFEEVKLMFQDLPSRIEHIMRAGSSRLRPLKRFHPMMIQEMAEMIGTDPENPAGLLVIASIFRDDLPWLYELILDTYHTVKAGDIRAIERAYNRLQKAVEVTMHGPFIEDIGVSREMHMMYRDLPMMLDHMLRRIIARPEKRIVSKKKKTES
jgi:hypothetical protein